MTFALVEYYKNIAYIISDEREALEMLINLNYANAFYRVSWSDIYSKDRYLARFFRGSLSRADKRGDEIYIRTEIEGRIKYETIYI